MNTTVLGEPPFLLAKNRKCENCGPFPFAIGPHDLDGLGSNVMEPVTEGIQASDS